MIFAYSPLSVISSPLAIFTVTVSLWAGLAWAADAAAAGWLAALGALLDCLDSPQAVITVNANVFKAVMVGFHLG